MDLISVSRRDGLELEVRVRGHELVVDLSERDGGRDGGPAPVDLLVGSLGACIAMMVQRYCDRHGYHDGEVGVSLTYELAESPKRIAAITVDLEVPRDLPERKRAAVLRVARLCVIHGTLNHPPQIDLEIV